MHFISYFVHIPIENNGGNILLGTSYVDEDVKFSLKEQYSNDSIYANKNVIFIEQLSPSYGSLSVP